MKQYYVFYWRFFYTSLRRKPATHFIAFFTPIEFKMSILSSNGNK